MTLDCLINEWFAIEDNNTRVLFERILSSISPEKSGLVVSGILTFFSETYCLSAFSGLLTKFLEFETNVGDLASVLKVEKRNRSVVQEVSSDDCIVCCLILQAFK